MYKMDLLARTRRGELAAIRRPRFAHVFDVTDYLGDEHEWSQ